MAEAPNVTILHLSDPQFGKNHRFGSSDPFDTLLQRLADDLRALRKERDLRPDLLVLTGDLAEQGRKSEFDDALRFLQELRGILGLGPERVVIIPGNHDVNRPACEAYFKDCESDETAPVPPYWPKWKHYVRAFHDLYRDQPGIEFTQDEPWTLFEIPELRAVIAGLNSTMAERHDQDHHGWVGEAQLRWFAECLERYRDEEWLRIGAVHHNVVRGAMDDDENLKDADGLERVLGPYVNLVLHGHTHDGKLHWLTNKVPILSTGSAALAAGARPPEVPNQYQVIRVERDKLRRWARQYAAKQKRWIGDPSVSEKGDQWWDDHDIAFDRLALAGGTRRTRDEGLDEPRRDLDERRLGGEPRDDFLARVARVCELREGADARVERIRAGEPPVEYLRVSAKRGGFPEVRAVGAVRDSLTPEAFDAFLAVHRRYQQTDRGVPSTLVCGGDPVPADLTRRASVAADGALARRAGAHRRSCRDPDVARRERAEHRRGGPSGGLGHAPGARR